MTIIAGLHDVTAICAEVLNLLPAHEARRERIERMRPRLRIKP